MARDDVMISYDLKIETEGGVLLYSRSRKFPRRGDNGKDIRVLEGVCEMMNRASERAEEQNPADNSAMVPCPKCHINIHVDTITCGECGHEFSVLAQHQ